MNERRPRRGRGGRGRRPSDPTMDNSEDNPYRETGPADSGPPPAAERLQDDSRSESRDSAPPSEREVGERDPSDAEIGNGGGGGGTGSDGATATNSGPRESGGGGGHHPRRDRGDRGDRADRPDRGGERFDRNGRRHRRHRGRGRRGGGPAVGGGGAPSGTATVAGGDQQTSSAPVVLSPMGDTQGWFDPSRDGGFIRRAGSSYLAEPGDAWVAPQVARQAGIRKGDHVHALIGKDPRGRVSVMEVQTVNGA